MSLSTGHRYVTNLDCNHLASYSLSDQENNVVKHAQEHNSVVCFTHRHDDEMRTLLVIEVSDVGASGQSNKEIANHLGITKRTVRTHVGNLLGKLKAGSRSKAALLSVRVGDVRFL
jgi:DNA-binding NarL/FixJ family response regulator